MVVMRIDVIPIRWLILAGVVSIFALILSIIIGATGPSIYSGQLISAVDCPDGSHVWTNGCNGVNIANNGTRWGFQTPSLVLLNSFWVLEAIPFSVIPDADVIETVRVSVDIYVKKNVDDSKWLSLRVGDIHEETVECFKGKAECTGFLLVYEEFIEYPLYFVEVSFPDPHPWITDIVFEFAFVNSSFSKFAMGFRFTYAIINALVFFFYVFKMRASGPSFHDWTWEQRSMTILLVALFCLNNPLFPFEFVSRGWFFRFVSALLSVLFQCLLLLFWLFMIDKIRRDDNRVEFSCVHVPKVVVVCIYGILSLILFAWVSVRDREDPVYGDGIFGIQMMYYVVTMLWTGIITWVGILAGLTIPVAIQKPYLLTRMLFFVIPTGICIISLISGIFAGTFGPFGQNTLSFLYYLTMYNVWVYLLTWGFFRVKEGFSSARFVTEASPLTSGQRGTTPEDLLE